MDKQLAALVILHQGFNALPQFLLLIPQIYAATITKGLL